MNDDREYDREGLFPMPISDEAAVALCDFLAELSVEMEMRYLVQLRRYRVAHSPPVNPEHPWRDLNTD